MDPHSLRIMSAFTKGLLGAAAVLALLAIIGLTYGLAQTSPLASPLPDGAKRLTPLYFGLYVTPEKNPISPPERFIGYHSGLDFEILPGEEEKEVPVLAACDGKVIYNQWAGGYGGLVIQQCFLKGDPVTVLYGHLDAASVLFKEGDALKTGQVIGNLGNARSEETDGVRKHLHFSVHMGDTVALLGYVQTDEELGAFIDPATLLSE